MPKLLELLNVKKNKLWNKKLLELNKMIMDNIMPNVLIVVTL